LPITAKAPKKSKSTDKHSLSKDPSKAHFQIEGDGLGDIFEHEDGYHVEIEDTEEEEESCEFHVIKPDLDSEHLNSASAYQLSED
jgi:hypothetical protein